MQEPKAVEYRIHSLKGKWDLGVFGALSIKNQLTEHFGGAVVISRSFNEYLALDLLLDGGAGQVTKFTKDLRSQVPPGKTAGKDDLADGGALVGTAQLGLRFTPFYGKFSVASELPVHFNFYFNAGLGGAFVKYNSIIGCENDVTGGNTCPGGPDDPASYHVDSRPSFAFNFGGGLRLYITQKISARLEVRDIIFPDRYYTNFTPYTAASTRKDMAANPGLTHVPLLLLGVGFLL
jgi:outer membrane beta-barrel protein